MFFKFYGNKNVCYGLYEHRLFFIPGQNCLKREHLYKSWQFDVYIFSANNKLHNSVRLLACEKNIQLQSPKSGHTSSERVVPAGRFGAAAINASNKIYFSRRFIFSDSALSVMYFIVSYKSNALHRRTCASLYVYRCYFYFKYDRRFYCPESSTK